MHALRHYFASVLLDAGESIRTVSDYLGHADPGFTLRVYTHLIPSSEERARQAVDLAHRAGSEDGSTAPKGQRSTRRIPETETTYRNGPG